jgi:hypothetical protein
MFDKEKEFTATLHESGFAAQFLKRLCAPSLPDVQFDLHGVKPYLSLPFESAKGGDGVYSYLGR